MPAKAEVRRSADADARDRAGAYPAQDVADERTLLSASARHMGRDPSRAARTPAAGVVAGGEQNHADE